MRWVHPTVCLSVSGGEKESLTESSSGLCDLCGLHWPAQCRHAAELGLGHGEGSLALHQAKVEPRSGLTVPPRSIVVGVTSYK